MILSCIENLTSLSYVRPLSKRKEEKRKEEGRGKEGKGEVWTGYREGREGDKEREKLFSYSPCSLSSQVLRKASLLLSVVAAPPQTLPTLSQRLLLSLCPLFSRRHQSLDEGPILVITSCQLDVICSNSISPKRPDSWV